MRVIFLSENFPPESNAAATRVYERALYWVQDGHEITIVTCAPNFPEGRLYDGYENRWWQVERMDGMTVIRVKTYISENKGTIRRTLDFLSFGITGFFAALGGPRPDVIAATSPQFFAAVAGWAAGAVRGVPFVFELGDLWPASISAVGAVKASLPLRAMEKIELFLYRRSAAVAALTNAFKRNLVRRGIDGDKIAVVINGVDLPRYAPRPKNGDYLSAWGLEGKFVVGYVGTHGMAHALGYVLNAAEKLLDRDDIRFLFVGAGADRDNLIADAERRKLSNIVFVPRQVKEVIPAVWSVCDVALVHLKNNPAFAEVIPSKIFEAEGMGLPVLLAAPAGEAREIVDADGCGICIPAEDPEALANAVVSLERDRDSLRAFARASQSAAPRHSRKEQARQMLQVLSLAAEGRGNLAGKPECLDKQRTEAIHT